MAQGDVRLSISVPEETWKKLRDLAESERLALGRASVAYVVGKIIQERLSADNGESQKVETVESESVRGKMR